jgi:hypothetical protein
VLRRIFLYYTNVMDMFPPTDSRGNMFPRTGNNKRHQCYQLEPCGVRGIDVCVQRSWQMLTGESPVVVKVGQPLSQ